MREIKSRVIQRVALAESPLARSIAVSLRRYRAAWGERSQRQHPLWRAAVIVALGLLAVMLNLLFLRDHPYTLLYAYVIFAAWFGDTSKGLLALGVSAAASLLLFARSSLLVDQIIFIAASLFLLAVMHDLRVARHQAQEARQRAQEGRQQAQLAQQQAEEALRLRDDFLAAASHDLRTPLTNIVGRTDLIRMHLDAGGTPDPAWLRTQVTSLRYSAKRMQAMVAEITDAAQLQEGKALSLQTAPVDIGTLVRSAVDTVTMGLRAKAAITIDAPTGMMVMGDAQRLERVIENLLTNAVKYSPAGGPVQVTAWQMAHWAVVSVRDRGVGIPTDEIPHIFTRFYRASTAHGIPGAGLGLAGCKRIVEQHGGYITLESAEGQGTTVTIYLPSASTPGEDGQGQPARRVS